MKTSQFIWRDGDWISNGEDEARSPQLCLLFGTREVLDEHKEFYDKIREKYKEAEIVSCSSAGNIADEELIDDVIVATCVEFEKTTVKTYFERFEDCCAEELGNKLGKRICKDDLAYVLVLSSSGVNAGRFLKQLNSYITEAPISGGVAGDNFKFKKTVVGLNESIEENCVVAISFHGSDLRTYHGSRGGWDTFGPRRKVTRCEGNVLFEVDDKPIPLYQHRAEPFART